MSEIQKLTNTIRNYSESDLCYGTLVTLKKIDNEAMRLEITLTEARAEIERLNKNMRFATAINLAMQEAGQDLPDLRGHECLAKHKLLSLFDFWHKKVRPRLPGFIDDEISQRDEMIEQMRLALEYALTEARSTECERLIKAALSAAEMGGK